MRAARERAWPRGLAPERFGARGLVAAAVIVGAWGLGLGWWLWGPLSAVSAWWWPLGVAAQTFLHTGLFITAHDAMHGVVYPRHRGVNDGVGVVAAGLYALFGFRRLRGRHLEHHARPGRAGDPDHHDGERAGFWWWYVTFMRRYLSAWQVVGMGVVFNVLEHVAGVAAWRLLLFWVAPSLLSTLQLFYFGTYRPHRAPPTGAHADGHRATSSGYPGWLSLLTCYHFGYHWEHHAYPHLPWWRLPRTQGGGSGAAGGAEERGG